MNEPAIPSSAEDSEADARDAMEEMWDSLPDEPEAPTAPLKPGQADMLALFQAPPKLTNDALLNALLTETMADAGLLLREEFEPEDGEVQGQFELYEPSDLQSGGAAGGSPWLVDINDVERNTPAPVLPDASEFAREKLMTRPGMEWLADVEAVLIAPHSANPVDQLKQLRGFVDILENEAWLLPEAYFPRKQHPYIARKVIGADTETTGLDLRTRYGMDGRLLTETKLVGVTFAPHPNKGYYLPVRHTGTDGVMNWDPGVMATVLGEMARRFVMVWHNAAYDLEVCTLNGVEHMERFPYNLDTQILSYITDMNNPVHGLKPVSKRLLGRRMIEIAELFVGFGGIKKTAYIAFNTLEATQALVYGASDSMNTIGILFHILSDPDPKSNIFLSQALQLSLDHDTINTVRSMLRTALPVNFEYMFYAMHDAIFRQIMLQREINRVAGREINIGSQPQLLALLFDQFKLAPIAGMERGKNGNFSLNEKTLAKLHAAYPEVEILDLIVRYRKISANIVKIYTKLVTNCWVDALMPFTRAKINFSQTGASTGRFTSAGNSSKARVTVKMGSGKKPKRILNLQSGAFEAGVNAQGLPAKVPFRTAPARRIAELPPEAGIDLDQPYPPEVMEQVLKACAEL